MPLVTLTTDFGTRDPYVASMKGVILSRCPSANIVDLTHQIAAQDVLEGALFIAEAAQWFPHGTIHCVVVDPGVGSNRYPIIANAGGQYFVCPDNGLLTFIAKSTPIESAHIIERSPFLRDDISATFHGRDVFAPAAAALAQGLAMRDAGEAVSSLIFLSVPEVQTSETGNVLGAVLHIDRFGNVITNVRRDHFAQSDKTVVAFGTETIVGIADIYSDVAAGEPVALFGSSGYLEIAVHCGDAAERFGLRRGSRVEIRP